MARVFAIQVPLKDTLSGVRVDKECHILSLATHKVKTSVKYRSDRSLIVDERTTHTGHAHIALNAGRGTVISRRLYPLAAAALPGV